MDPSRLAALIAAAELGSLSRAAERLGSRLSTISRQVSDLETEIGAELLIRTGRGVRPTPAGERFIERARYVLHELDAAIAEARGEVGDTLTQLRLSAPVELALSLLPDCLASFHRQFPDVALDVHSEARRVSLLEEDYDAALRIGPLPDSSLIARPLGTIRLLLCGSPDLESRRVNTRDIHVHPFVAVAGTPSEFSAKHRGKSITIRPRASVRVSTFTEAAELAARTELAVVLPSYTARSRLEEGALVRLLPRLTLGSVDLHLLFSQRLRGSLHLARLGELLRARLGEIEGERP